MKKIAIVEPGEIELGTLLRGLASDVLNLLIPPACSTPGRVLHEIYEQAYNQGWRDAQHRAKVVRDATLPDVSGATVRTIR